MFARGVFAAFAALLISATLVGNADAYPTTARSGTTTVTGVYRPLDLDLTLIPGSGALSYGGGSLGGGNAFNYAARYNGTYTGSGTGYPSGGVTGVAGEWELRFSSVLDSFVARDNTDGSTPGTIITLSSSDVATRVGTLTFKGGGGADYTGVPTEDTPILDDYFELFAPTADDFLRVTCEDDVLTCNVFDMVLLQDLTQLGPFSTGFGGELEFDRLNGECRTSSGSPVPCGSVPISGFRASSVPEPASLALVGLGLAALALGRRRQQGLRRV